MPAGYAYDDNGVWYHSLHKTKEKSVFPAIATVPAETPCLARLLLTLSLQKGHFNHCKMGEV
jgi:hypothetical protein